MSDTDTTPEALRGAAQQVVQQLKLPYSVRMGPDDGLAYRFQMHNPDATLRTTVLVPRAARDSVDSVRADFLREVHTVLRLCALCSAEARIQRYQAAWMEVRCPNCGHFVIDVALARLFLDARLQGDERTLEQMRIVARESQGKGPVTLDKASFERIVREGRLK